MIVSNIGRYVVLLQIIAAAYHEPVVDAALRGRAAPGTAIDIDVNDNSNNISRHHVERALQDCAGYDRRSQCINAGCSWGGGAGCISAPAPDPTTEPTPSPTDAPTTSPPTKSPTDEPTTSPTPGPTKSPVWEGAGYCSDDASPCGSTSECSCFTARQRQRALQSSLPFTLQNDTTTTRHHHQQQKQRVLQTDCAGQSRKNTCENNGCVWQNKACIAPATPMPTPPPVTPVTPQPVIPVTGQPSKSPTDAPTKSPTKGPTDQPTGAPTPCACLGLGPTRSPTPEPTGSPTIEPTNNPSTSPTRNPTYAPSVSPTKSPTDSPTRAPTNNPSTSPTRNPRDAPSVSPTKSPTDSPTRAPTPNPTMSPIPNPTGAPSVSPTKVPTNSPTLQPTNLPTNSPTNAPSKSPTDAPSNSPVGAIINGQIDVPIVPSSSITLTVGLPPSAANKLITVSQVSSDNDDAVPVARSYDGQNFETLHPLLLPIDCDSGPSCTIDIPPHSGQAAMHYIIQEYNPQAKTSEQDFSRLLLQGTYGPTQTSLSEAETLGSAAAWVQDQMNKPMSLLRVHYRRRANAYTKNDMYRHGTRLACEQGSRWARAAFNRWRDVGKTIVEEATGTGSWYLKVDGVIRTEVATQPSVENGLGFTSYVICRSATSGVMKMSAFVEAPSGEKGVMVVAASSADCVDMVFTEIEMPGVFFSSSAGIPSANLVSMSDPNIIDAKILQNVVAPSTCSDFKRTWPNFVQDESSGLYFVEDRRVELYENTDGATTQKKRLLDGRCPQVPKTFLNEDTCQIRSDCSVPVFSGGDFQLNAQTLRRFYELDGKLLYRIQNLPLLDTPSPCNSNANRFVRKDPDGDGTGCSNDSGQWPSIAAAIQTSLSASEQESKRVITLSDSIGCTDANDDALGASFTVPIPGSINLSCWTHSYIHEWSVFVMNDWAVNHPGNARYYRESKSNPIARAAEQEDTGNAEDQVTLNYPPWGFHQWNFHNNRWRFDRDLVGSWGDRILFSDLPDSAKSADVITDLGGTVVANSGKLIEVCGSPGEVGNDPSSGFQYLLQKYGDAEEEFPDVLDQDHERWHSTQMIWNTVTLNAPDQLRHRVAWALASIFVVAQNDIGLEDVSEQWSYYYDIFVRNAFGSSFFDLLKEVAFSPLMGTMLTFEGSKSLAYQVERNGASLYPDENFAREIMQLFSIGLYMLNQDGTKIIDETTGQPVPTYDNDDIMNFSRGWTNFKYQPDERDNIEAEWSQSWMTNRLDPMFLPSSEGRDVFPKQTLLVDGKRNYIGDKIQRCDAMPDKPWIKKGAVWEFRKDNQSLKGKQDPDWWVNPETWTPRIILSPAESNLYNKLCNYNVTTGQCEFKSTVVLDEDIDCSGSCTAGRSKWDEIASPSSHCECSIDEPRTVRVDHSSTLAPVWYEYVRAPCVQLAFPESGNMNTVKEIGSSGYGNSAMCADSRYAVAGTTCCDSGGSPVNICVFKGERTTYQTAVDRCADYGIGYSTCSWDTVPVNWDCGTDTDYGQGSWSVHKSPGMRFSWNSQSCSMNVQIGQNGNVAMVHSVGSNTVKERVGVDTGTYFGVSWSGSGSYPEASSNCGGIAGCQVQGSTCICSTSVQTTRVFDGSLLPSAGELMSQLHIGSSDPTLFDTGHYSLCTATSCTAESYNIWSRTFVDSNANLASAFDEETIFEVTDLATGLPLFLSNAISIVGVGGGHSFRNPPMYNSPIDPTQRDALYETDSILQNYAKHPNTAPYIATKLIQHLITSNPSPRYVRSVADSFRTGFYDGTNFGSGGYGDMEATVAAIMLDSEARSTTLDDDANSGRAREPLLKIMHMYRSMELSTSSGTNREIDMIYLLDRGIGQEAFRSPSVFSFFLSEYQPVGPVLNKGLVAPETQLFDSPKLIGFINGLFSVPIYGLSDCIWWQGLGAWRARYRLPDHPDGGVFDCGAEGIPLQLKWKPPSWGGQTNVESATVSAVMDDLDLLLTGGRLHSANRALLEQVYNDTLTGSDPLNGSDPHNNALKSVLQHFVAAPEFHITNNLVDSSSTTEPRPVPDITTPQNPPAVEGYKAIVYLFMAGASDSFSMLAPMTGCNPLHGQYLSVRGDVAIQSASLLSIDASTSNQPCNSFGLHPSLQTIHGLYNQGDASWVSNIGPLVEPLDKFEFEAGSKPVPQSLFAHNTQTQVTQAVFAQDGSAGGVLGRIGDALNDQEGEEIFDGYSISGTPKILEGAPGVSRPADVLSGYGVSKFNPLVTPYAENNIETLSENIVTSIHGETFSSSMTNAIYRMRFLDEVVGGSLLAEDACFNDLNTDISRQLQQVARLIKNRDGFEANRDVYYTQIGGFDTHSDNGPALSALLTQIDLAIGCFHSEMMSQTIWNNVTVISASEFGRTLTSNGLGTDHAWGGNHFILGGSVKGGMIHGQYPDDLTDQGILNIGRGRLIPTTPWEGVWNGLGEWFGVTSQNLASVLPNLANFETNIFSETDLFK